MSDITSVKRAVDILNLYSQGNHELGPTEVSRKLGINKATVVRLMSTLTSAKLLQKSGNERKYVLNSHVMDLAWAFASKADLSAVAMPFMQEIRKETDEAITICVQEGSHRLCVATLESAEYIRTGSHVGEISPLHAGSPGTVILAGLPDGEIDQIIKKNGLSRHTDLTITNRNELKKVIAQIREQGVWVSRGEYAQFAFAVSAPLRNYTGKVIGSLNINGVTMRLTEEKEKQYKSLVKDKAADISKHLGYWPR
jgi:IclR family transcriptional regulator, KDG regulon repressor